MKAEIDFPDPVIEAIAQRVVESLRPLLVRKQEAPDAIFTTDQLAEYLGVRKQRIYDMVSQSTIPFFKIGKYPRFKKSAVEKWIDSQSVPVANPLSRSLKVIK